MLIIAEPPATPDVGRNLVGRIFAFDHQIIKNQLGPGVAHGEVAIKHTGQALAIGVFLNGIGPQPPEMQRKEPVLPSPRQNRPESGCSPQTPPYITDDRRKQSGNVPTQVAL